MSVAVTLRTLRLRAGLTQQQLADQAGIDRSWYNQMERGNRPITRSPGERLASVLGVSPAELGVRDEKQPEYQSLPDRLEELQGSVELLVAENRRMANRVKHLSRRVLALERLSQTEATGQQ